MLFAYKAKSASGQIVEGTMESPDKFSLAHDLRLKGIVALSVTEKKAGALNAESFFQNLLSRVKTADLIILTKNLSGMIRAGLSLSRALTVLEKQTKKPALTKILASVSADISSGSPLSAALEKFPSVFSKLFTSMTRAGEESGNLAGALSDIGQNLEKAHNLTKKVRGALIYPGVILSAMVVIGVLMFAFVVPTLASTFKELGVTLPLTTRFLIAVGTFFSEHLILTFLIIVAGIFMMIALFRAQFMAKYIDYAVLRLPLIGTLAKELNTARTARTISSLLLAGVSITRAVDITVEVVQNIYYKNTLAEARSAIEKGATFSSIFESNPKLYPVMMAEMIQVGEETGKLSDMLIQVAVFYEEEIESKTKNLSTIIEPLLMIVIGAGVGFFAISMISPLYSILGEIG